MQKLKSLLRSIAWWILGNVKPAEDEIDVALRGAFQRAGLPSSAYSLEFDILHSGKLHEVLVHASAALGNPLMTVGDVKELLG